VGNLDGLSLAIVNARGLVLTQAEKRIGGGADVAKGSSHFKYYPKDPPSRVIFSLVYIINYAHSSIYGYRLGRGKGLSPVIIKK
jgi:hypothetical protein